jgi:hypothetical protein
MASKLDIFNYPIADPEKWLVFIYPHQKKIDPIFAGRLAALGQHFNKKITIVSGRRTTEEQTALFIKYGGKQDSKGNWVGGNGYAARPGISWHEFGQAIDTSDIWLKNLEKDKATNSQKILTKFGVFKPLTEGNKKSVLEDWHIQPIETDGIDVVNRRTFLTFEEEEYMFVDLIKNDNKHWAADLIQQAAKLGIVKGIKMPNGQYVFNPEGNITRAESVALIMRAIEYLKKK